jgi:hypothetical protein
MMTDLQLESLIDSLNNDTAGELIFLTPLSSLVEYGKVWTIKPSPGLASYEPRKIYCIKNAEGIYVAAVMNAGSNLYWLVSKQYRRQGHLPKALQEVILPHIFQYRKEQRITINEQFLDKGFFTASTKIAVNAGFVKISTDGGVSTFLAHNTGRAIDKNFKEPGNTVISKERVIALKKQLNFISQSLLLVQTEIEIKRGVSKYSEKLKELSNDIYRNMDRLDNICCNNSSN